MCETVQPFIAYHVPYIYLVQCVIPFLVLRGSIGEAMCVFIACMLMGFVSLRISYIRTHSFTDNFNVNAMSRIILL